MIRTYSVSPWDGSSFAYWEKTLLNTAYWILTVVEKKENLPLLWKFTIVTIMHLKIIRYMNVNKRNIASVTGSCASREGEYGCNSLFCISRTLLCDGHPDCPNGSDETPSLCGTSTIGMTLFILTKKFRPKYNKSHWKTIWDKYNCICLF